MKTFFDQYCINIIVLELKIVAKKKSDKKWIMPPSYENFICQYCSLYDCFKRNAQFLFQWIELDGNSLSIEDLMKIGGGKYRVKVRLWVCAYT